MGIFNFSDYRRYLHDHFRYLPKKGRGVISKIAEHLNVSTTLVSQVLSGDKNFSLEQAQGVADYLALSEIEADYFILLVHLERAGTSALKKYYEKKIGNLKEKSLKISNRIEVSKALSNEERSVFYSSHIYAAIWLYTSLGKNGKTIDEVVKYFDLPRTRVLDVIRFLHETNLCTEQNGYYKMGTQSTHVEKGSPHLLHHYRNWRLLSIQQSESITDEELMYSAAVSLSKKDFEVLREEMVAFIKKFLKTTHESPAEEIAYLNLDFLRVK